MATVARTVLTEQGDKMIPLDLLARIILKECGYTGTYQTQLAEFTSAEPVDWVQSTLDAAKLRFC